MTGRRARSAVIVIAAGLAGASAAAGQSGERSAVADRLAREAGLTVARITGPAEDFSRHCQGCHGHRGVSVPEVPTLQGRAGFFVHTPEGRAYLARVPGVAFAHLSDADLAAVLNWMLRTYSAAQLPADFEAYTAEEVAALRADPLDDIERERTAVIEGLVRAGAVTDAGLLDFGSNRRY